MGRNICTKLMFYVLMVLYPHKATSLLLPIWIWCLAFHKIAKYWGSVSLIYEILKSPWWHILSWFHSVNAQLLCMTCPRVRLQQYNSLNLYCSHSANPTAQSRGTNPKNESGDLNSSLSSHSEYCRTLNNPLTHLTFPNTERKIKILGIQTLQENWEKRLHSY